MSASAAPHSGVARGVRSDVVAGIVIVLVAVAVGWQNRVYPIGSLAEPGPPSVIT